MQYRLQAAVITGIEYEKETQAVKAGTEEVQTQMGNLVVENGDALLVVLPGKSGGSYSGTGDLFASILSAGLVRGMSMMDLR